MFLLIIFLLSLFYVIYFVGRNFLKIDYYGIFIKSDIYFSVVIFLFNFYEI